MIQNLIIIAIIINSVSIIYLALAMMNCWEIDNHLIKLISDLTKQQLRTSEIIKDSSDERGK